MSEFEAENEVYHSKSFSKSPRVYEEVIYETQVYHDPCDYVPADVPFDFETKPSKLLLRHY